jgi:5'-3' exoribonuclease 2
MAVLPSESAAALPEPCRELMLSPTSEIADFYPRDVPVDPNGKAMPWLWVLLLPFIDESRLVETIAPIFEKLTPEEGKRNALSAARIFVHASHALTAKLQVRTLIAHARVFARV